MDILYFTTTLFLLLLSFFSIYYKWKPKLIVGILSIFWVSCLLLANENSAKGKYINSVDEFNNSVYDILYVDIKDDGYSTFLLKKESEMFPKYFILNLSRKEKEDFRKQIESSAKSLNGDIAGNLQLRPGSPGADGNDSGSSEIMPNPTLKSEKLPKNQK